MADATRSPEKSVTTATGIFGPLTDEEVDLIGTDANANGVRDDVEAWIGETFRDSATRDAAILNAQWQTWVMLRGARGHTSTVKEFDSWAAASSCLFEKAYEAMGDKMPKPEDWESKQFNTLARTRAYLKGDATADGMMISTSMSPCNDVTSPTIP